MKRRMNNQGAYIVKVEERGYFVNMIRLNNDINGNPRLEAHVTTVSSMLNYNGYCSVYVYRFSGHHINEKEEAEWIAKRVHEELNREDQERNVLLSYKGITT